MSYFKSKSIWFWGFIILLIINLSVMGSMAYVMNKMHRQPDYKAFHHKFKKEKHTKQSTKRPRAFMKEMGLDDNQRASLDQIHREHAKSSRAIKAELKLNHRAFFDEMTKSNPDSSLIQKYKNEDCRLNQEMMEESISFFSKMKEDLSPEQQEMLKEYFKKKMKPNKQPKN